MSLSASISEHDSSRSGQALQTSWLIALLAGLLAAMLFAVTLQTHINGSLSYYATDVGEIQNALPRWGTLHFTGYPQYSIIGSSIVTVLRLARVEPAAGASMVSLLCGALTIALVARVAMEKGAAPLAALTGALMLALATSMWIDASIAEVHTMTMALTAATLWFAVRFGRDGRRVDLLWLVFVVSQGVVHTRAAVCVVPALLVIIAPQWRTVLRHILPVAGIGVVAPLLYVYMPLREWMGADWTFGNTSTWRGFWAMVLDSKADRIVSPPAGLADWVGRGRVMLDLLVDDLPLLLLIAGVVGLFTVRCPVKSDYWREVTANHLMWVPYVGLGMIIWEGRASDALLAVKLPVPMMAGVGLALLITRIAAWRAVARYGVLAVCGVALLITGCMNYPKVIAVTRDRSVEATITAADQAANPGCPLVLTALWGRSYWALRYAQEYRGQIEGVVLVDHNLSPRDIIDNGSILVTLSETFYLRPLGWWADMLGPVYLDTYAPGLIEIRSTPREGDEGADLLEVNDDLAIESAGVEQSERDSYVITVHWRALKAPERDYSIAVHLLAAHPPAGPQDIVAQADTIHPVEGWYPTTRWIEGQSVRDMYQLIVPPDIQPAAIRVTAYYVTEAGEFVNGNWLVVPLGE